MSLKEIVKERLLGDMLRAVKPTNGRWKVLVVDKLSLRIISAGCRMYDIMEEGVTLVENIDLVRQPLSELDAIYFLTPTKESVQRLCSDFRKKPQYRMAHVFFTSKLHEDLFQQIGSCEPLVQRMATLIEINLEFLAVEQQVFSLDCNNALEVLFSPEQRGVNEMSHRIAAQLLTTFITLGEMPAVRYAKNQPVAAKVANLLKDKINAFEQSGVPLNPTGSSREPMVCLILDRSVDALAPVLHEFTYQSMVYDLLPIENDRYQYRFVTKGGDDQQKEVLLNETDQLWPTLQHMHIADVINYVISMFNEFLKNNKASKLACGKVDDLREMSEAVKQMPQYRELLSKYSLHINMSQECMKIFSQRKLESWSRLEQNMAMGEDADGNKLKDLLTDMTLQLQTKNEDGSVPFEERLRLIITYLITQEGLSDSDRRRMVEHAELTPEQLNAINNLHYLGVTLVKGTKKQSKGKVMKKKRKTDDVGYDLSRYTPTVKDIVEEMLDDRLSLIDFPYSRESKGQAGQAAQPASAKGGKSVRSTQAAAPSWAKTSKNKDKTKVTTTGGRVMVFVVGGTTYSETRAIYELKKNKNRDVILGSTGILTARAFINHLQNIKQAESVDLH
eukprot:TRINITY_DN20099_c0_g1::TRINITY_DN20099_c0_g1_i1::g.15642::m.15642 TRINITY_DN20099_c0_g1::TRINITY_DN20099_c0_g1_i1::g.15642  ORF type:complete len:633 (-),score=173.74,sp/Q54QC8/SEC1_DICDI/41.18/7e-155,Sec1/PF00995.18/1.1e-136,GARS_C/PF02843.11/2.9e+03,GARS_C/PF02843.11/0.5 TRINITY_DN20099_c0_g1_i1:410-2260(-)